VDSLPGGVGGLKEAECAHALTPEGWVCEVLRGPGKALDEHSGLVGLGLMKGVLGLGLTKGVLGLGLIMVHLYYDFAGGS
jgi:hypothetical protein